MKALSIRQPYAWLIVHGIEDVENRSWHTHYRGPLLIHASQAVDAEDIRIMRERLAEQGITLPEELPRGGIVGVATLVDCIERVEISWWRRLLCRLLGKDRVSGCVDQPESIWFEGPYGFILRDARPLPFVPWRGQQKFFDVPEHVFGGELDL